MGDVLPADALREVRQTYLYVKALTESHEELRRERDAITEAARELLREWSSPGSMVAAVDRLRSVLSDQEGQ